MIYEQAQSYLNSFIDYEQDTNYVYTDIKLERVKILLAELGNPQDTFKSIHIAGTKGKGSTCAFIFSILRESGFKVGLYTSPHLIDFRERIKISCPDELGQTKERLITEDEVCRLVEELKPHTDKIKNLTFFEVYTVLAFKFFAQMGLDFAVLETGLGGRLDATNVVTPIVCGITGISYDHTNMLGNTLEKIAKEKAGIIKKDSLVVIAPQPPDAWKIIAKKCEEKKSRLYEVGKDFLYDSIGQDLNGSVFDFRGIFEQYESLHIPLIGPHQLINASLALGIIQVLRLYEVVISLLAIQRGLENTRWPGRMQLIHKHPFFLLDGAQNAASARILMMAIDMLFIPKKFILILGVSKDKDVKGICGHLCRQPSLIILTQAQTRRAMSVEELEKVAARPNRNVIKTRNVSEALKLAVKNVGPDDLILVAGSLYLIGEVLKAFRTIEFPKP